MAMMKNKSADFTTIRFKLITKMVSNIIEVITIIAKPVTDSIKVRKNSNHIEDRAKNILKTLEKYFF